MLLLWTVLIVVPFHQASAVDVVVVCPSNFGDALTPWLDYRRKDGLEITVIEPESDAKNLRAKISDAANNDTGYVVLVGDAPVFGTPCNVLRQIPMIYSPTTVTKAWGSTPTLSSDLLFGDFDQDGLPDAAVGRMPVDDPMQLTKLIRRIQRHESNEDFGAWRGRIQLVTGVGGFGMMADRAIESVTRTIVTGVLPSETRTSVAYASEGHPFCPQQPFTDAVVDRYSQGSRFWVYAGHGQITELDRFPQNASGTPVLDQRSVQRLQSPSGNSPIAMILACFTGAMDASEDSIAEEMILSDGGPIAVLAGSRVTMPYGNTTAAVGLIDAVYGQHLPRLGDAWLSALVEMHQETTEDTSTTRVMIDALAAVVSPAGTKLVDERREHMSLYNLIGDPLLKLNHPKPVSIQVDPGHDLGAAIKVSVNSSIAGDLVLSFDRPLGAVTEGDPNETTVVSMTGRVKANIASTMQVIPPADVQGAMVVRAFISGKDSWATAATKTIIRQADR